MNRAVLHHIASDYGKNSSIGFRSQKILDYYEDKIDITVICRSNKTLNKKKIWTIIISYYFSRIFSFITIYVFSNFPARKYELNIFNILSLPYIILHFIKNKNKKRVFHSWDTSLWLLQIVKKLEYKIIKDCAMTPAKISLIESNRNPSFYLDKKTSNKTLKDEKSIFDISKIIISPSKFTTKFIIDEYHILPEKLKTIPFGVNFKKFSTSKKRKFNNKLIRFGFVGLVNMRKGIRWLINDLNKLYSEDNIKFELHLYGRIFMEEENLLNNTKFKIFKYGFVNSSKTNIYNNFDILIHPSFIEGSAKCIYEAMASGLPIICTEASGSLVHNKKNGFIIKAGDSDALLSSIRFFNKNKSYVYSMGKESENIIKRYSWERYAKKVNEIYM